MAELDLSSVSQRVMRSMQMSFEEACFFIAKDYASFVESEIELMLLSSFVLGCRLFHWTATVAEEFPEGEKVGFLITPQFKWNGYRIDFCFRHAQDGRPAFVECDGHDFHERTKEQAEHDRSKDRAIQSAGIPILRFTGREIWRDSERVVAEIINFVAERAKERL